MCLRFATETGKDIEVVAGRVTVVVVDVDVLMDAGRSKSKATTDEIGESS